MKITFLYYSLALLNHRRLIKKSVLYFENWVGWSIDTKADSFFIGIVNPEHVHSRLFGSKCVRLL